MPGGVRLQNAPVILQSSLPPDICKTRSAFSCKIKLPLTVIPMIMICGGVCLLRAPWVFFALPLHRTIDMLIVSSKEGYPPAKCGKTK